jgi:hypothetical protein
MVVFSCAYIAMTEFKKLCNPFLVRLSKPVTGVQPISVLY